VFEWYLYGVFLTNFPYLGSAAQPVVSKNYYFHFLNFGAIIYNIRKLLYLEKMIMPMLKMLPLGKSEGI
jgi:hypothetical protein